MRICSQALSVGRPSASRSASILSLSSVLAFAVASAARSTPSRSAEAPSFAAAISPTSQVAIAELRCQLANSVRHVDTDSSSFFDLYFERSVLGWMDGFSVVVKPNILQS